MDGWRERLRFDPMPPLLASDSEALRYFARRDLLGEAVGPIQSLWDSPEAARLLKKQLPDGSWPRAGAASGSGVDYPLVETWRRFRLLVDLYGMTREHASTRAAAEFLFSRQTQAGDFRGFLANQYATYYSGAILGLLIKAGYAEDRRIERGFRWLLAMRQDDGGWTIPLLTHKLDRETQYRMTSEYAEPLEPDRSKPFSHNWTGMVLRAFASHPVHRSSEAARVAAGLLVSRFFQPDVYTSYKAASYWVKFDFPFWWNNLVAALDSVSAIMAPERDERIEKALEWLIVHQGEDGAWELSYAEPRKKRNASAEGRETRLWVSLAICRIVKSWSG